MYKLITYTALFAVVAEIITSGQYFARIILDSAKKHTTVPLDHL